MSTFKMSVSKLVNICDELTDTLHWKIPGCGDPNCSICKEQKRLMDEFKAAVKNVKEEVKKL